LIVLDYLKKYKYFLGLFIILILFILAFYYSKEDDEVVFEPIEEILEEKEIIKEEVKIKVDIKGAVINPGVYELEENSRVKDAIDISGGLNKEADTSTINLSKLLKDEMVIIIYTKEEIEEMKKGSTSVKYIEKECICPKIENDACIEEKVTNEENDEDTEKTNKVSLNNATIEQLMTLQGIGESKAKLIIEYREKNGGFKSIDEITNVKGIGLSTYEKIKDNLTL